MSLKEATARELAKVKQEIRDRRNYLKQQEVYITEVIENWNTDLVMLRQEIKLAHDEKAELLRDIVRLREDRQILGSEVERLENRVIDLVP